jgi:heptaprenyl diphosphate synthase
MASLGIPEISPEFEAQLSEGLSRVEIRLREQIVGKYPLVIETSRHLVDAGGKRLRPLLTLISSHYGDPSRTQVIDAAVVCELNASRNFVSR